MDVRIAGTAWPEEVEGLQSMAEALDVGLRFGALRPVPVTPPKLAPGS